MLKEVWPVKYKNRQAIQNAGEIKEMYSNAS
jgi:hypothetical protein